MTLGFNGYVTMKFVRPKQSDDTSLYLNYKSLSLSLNEEEELTDENPTILINEEWSVDSNGNVVLIKLQSLNEELTKSVHKDTDNHGLTFVSNESSCCTTLEEKKLLVIRQIEKNYR